MRGSMMVRVLVCLVAVGVLGDVFSNRAGAWPPPPRFTDITVVNNTQVEIFDIRVEIDLSDPADRSQILVPSNGTPYGFTIARLPAGRSVTVSTGPGSQGIEGVARIRLKGAVEAPLGTPLMQDVVIEAKRDNFDESTPELEWSGFCSSAPQGESDYKARLEFRMNTTMNKLEAHLTAKWRWDEAWPAAAIESSGWFPGGGQQQGN